MTGIVARTSPLRVTERAFQQAVIEYAQLMGWAVFHPFDSRRSEAGWPDLVLVRDRIVFAELKREGGRLTDAQREWGERLERAGARWFCWRPSSWAAIEAELKRTTPAESLP